MDSSKNPKFLTPSRPKQENSKNELSEKTDSSPDLPRFGGLKKTPTLQSNEEEKLILNELGAPKAATPESRIPYVNKVERLKAKMESWETFWQYFVSYQVSNLDSFIDIYFKHGASILQWLDYEAHESIDISKRSIKSKSTTVDSSSGKEEISLDDIKMEWCDRIPHVSINH